MSHLQNSINDFANIIEKMEMKMTDLKTEKILATFAAKHYPADHVFMIDIDDERLGHEYLPVAVDCWYRADRSLLITGDGEHFHIDSASWEASEIRFKKGRKGILSASYVK